MAKIYLSSTYDDLEEHREHVCRMLRKLSHDVIAMEDYVASDQRPADKCLADVEASDVYIGLFAWRYGYVPDKDNPSRLSITELEYRKAVEKGKPQLIFLTDTKAAWPPPRMDVVTGDNERGKRIADLRSELEKDKIRATFTSPHELAGLVAAAITAWEKTKEPIPLPEGSRNAVPQVWTGDLPTPTTSVFIGRDEAIADLDKAWEKDPCHVVTVVGTWGVGKSTLIRHWLREMKADHYRGAQCVFGWSFRGQGSEEHRCGDDFFRQALTCLNVSNPDFGLEEEKAIWLTKRIRGQRTLFLLDGLEVLQDKGGNIANAALRALILNLADQIDGLCVITSRLPVRDLIWDLTKLERCARAGPVWEIDLGALELHAATTLLKSLHLDGPDEAFVKAAKAHNGNPLSLSILAGVLARRYKGNIRRWPQVAGGIDGVLDSLALLLSSEEKAVMRLMGLFDGPAADAAVLALRAKPAIPGLSDVLSSMNEDEWGAALDNLRELQLLTEAKEERPGELDCHPMVRAYFAKQLQRDAAEAWEKGHFCLYQHFKKEESLGDIDNLYLAIHHGCKAGRHEEVFDELVWNKMAVEFALKRVNAHGAGARDEMTLRYFVPDPFDAEPQCAIKGFDGERKGRLFLWAAAVLQVLGRVPAAVKFAEHARGIFENTQGSQARLGFWCSSAYLSWFLAVSGDLDTACKLSADCVKGVEKDLQDEPIWRKIALCLHACIVSYTGDFGKALELYKQAMTKECDIPDGFEVTVAILRFRYACLLLELESYEEAELEAQKLKDAGTDSPNLGFLGYQVLARMELAKSLERSRKDYEAKRKNPLRGDEVHLAKAEEHFAKGKDDLNRGPAHDHTIVNALFMAQFYRIRGDLEEAANHLKRAEDAVGPFVLLNMDCLLERAWLFLCQSDAEKNKEKLKDVRSLVEKLHSLVEKHGYKWAVIVVLADVRTIRSIMTLHHKELRRCSERPCATSGQIDDHRLISASIGN